MGEEGLQFDDLVTGCTFLLLYFLAPVDFGINGVCGKCPDVG